jgi:hypothetical protein|tara:strand:+ start:1434 stop:1562 length:129 start_codon:yes stop_codon:yes gene_type:complete
MTANCSPHNKLPARRAQATADLALGTGKAINAAFFADILAKY